MQRKKPLYAAARKGKRATVGPKKGTGTTHGGSTGRDKPPAAAGDTRSATPRLLEEVDDLPAMYEETRVVLTVVDPVLVNVRWDLNPRQLTKVRKASIRGGRTSRPVLRFHEVAGPALTDQQVLSRFDVEIDLGAGNWYVPLWSGDKAYFVDLGFRTSEGAFYPLARSNTAEVPPSGPDEKDAAHLMLVTEEEGIIEAVEVAPAAAFHPSLRTAPDEEAVPRKGVAVPLTVAGARHSAPPSLTTRGTGDGGRRAIGIEVLWAFPEEVERQPTDETVPTPDYWIAVDLVARAEALFTPGVSS